MKLTQITYRRLFNTGSYTNESIELSGTLEPNEDTLNAYTQLHKMAEELHYSKNAEMYAQQGTQVRDIVEERSKDPRQAMMDDILACTELEGADGLLSFRKLSENDAEIKAVYDLQLLKLKK